MAALRFALHRSILAGVLGLPAASMALNTADVTISTASPDCLSYRVVGVCYWLFCTPFGCKVRTSPKVRHYVPDAVVASYTPTGENPWRDVRALSPSNPTGQSGAAHTSGNSHESPALRFKNADVIGHPGSWTFSQFAGQFGYTCAGAGTAFMPYLLSTLDTLAWRYGVPEAVYPEALTPGFREIGSRAHSDLWGHLYPRSGFVQQTDDYKAAAVIAQRAGDIVTRKGQVHVYRPLLADKRDGYWPAGALLESEASTGQWQELTPTLSTTCATFPHSNADVQARQGDYAWALWRPYSCCERRGQIFLGSVDFAGGRP
ncbi:TIGR03756 family integrating conjugative element protein [Pseudomonas fluorescens]|uniref:TIGR03756 family integrating conjugative element protein n=1 Tax=Pseudomonas fluorescens TaxID=294 RepID=UPI001BE72C08|nr:TIGR03756 family integrating conjugative element protein [Pseudomonas fluorescens]MBT2375348.1 TIGR03756 family integrating conjugative element protein [Pseudomonas fluorescens]